MASYTPSAPPVYQPKEYNRDEYYQKNKQGLSDVYNQQIGYQDKQKTLYQTQLDNYLSSLQERERLQTGQVDRGEKLQTGNALNALASRGVLDSTFEQSTTSNIARDAQEARLGIQNEINQNTNEARSSKDQKELSTNAMIAKLQSDWENEAWRRADNEIGDMTQRDKEAYEALYRQWEAAESQRQFEAQLAEQRAARAASGVGTQEALRRELLNNIMGATNQDELYRNIRNMGSEYARLGGDVENDLWSAWRNWKYGGMNIPAAWSGSQAMIDKYLKSQRNQQMIADEAKRIGSPPRQSTQSIYGKVTSPKFKSYQT